MSVPVWPGTALGTLTSLQISRTNTWGWVSSTSLCELGEPFRRVSAPKTFSHSYKFCFFPSPHWGSTPAYTHLILISMPWHTCTHTHAHIYVYMCTHTCTLVTRIFKDWLYKELVGKKRIQTASLKSSRHQRYEYQPYCSLQHGSSLTGGESFSSCKHTFRDKNLFLIKFWSILNFE